ncbi:mucin-3B-like [Polypterus senegalus]|uniref:mucin-3B-like n=1 Tax=Polypterus senegalus TaxID=55291 RepID=UPI0019643CFA|nr:mucin-3B-like [Polypterus senegalus]XP_039612195.1 mucin-3B-like [Polypterus senegalus]
MHYMNCSISFLGYTKEVIRVNANTNGAVRCVGPCARGYSCSGHGQCENRQTGPVCMCFAKTFQFYSGAHCEILERTTGFYAVVFGVTGAALLLLIVIILAIIVCKKNVQFKTLQVSNKQRRWFTLEEDHFNFQNTDLSTKATSLDGIHGRAGRYDFRRSNAESNETLQGRFTSKDPC